MIKAVAQRAGAAAFNSPHDADVDGAAADEDDDESDDEDDDEDDAAVNAPMSANEIPSIGTVTVASQLAPSCDRACRSNSANSANTRTDGRSSLPDATPRCSAWSSAKKA